MDIEKCDNCFEPFYFNFDNHLDGYFCDKCFPKCNNCDTKLYFPNQSLCHDCALLCVDIIKDKLCDENIKFSIIEFLN